MQKDLYQIFILILLIITSCSPEKKDNVRDRRGLDNTPNKEVSEKAK